MSNASLRSRLQRHPALVAAALAVLLLVGGPGSGDDRNLFRAESPSPYVMMLLDVSDSMTWRTDDTGARASGDDPNSKLYSAKSALYEVINDLPSRGGIGFAHFRQSNHQYKQKRWLYRRADTVANSSLPWYSELPWPQAGMALDFGDELRISQNASSGSLAGTVIDAADEFVFPLRITELGPPDASGEAQAGGLQGTRRPERAGTGQHVDQRLPALAARRVSQARTPRARSTPGCTPSASVREPPVRGPRLSGLERKNAVDPERRQPALHRRADDGAPSDLLRQRAIVYPNVGSGCPASVCGSGAGSPKRRPRSGCGPSTCRTPRTHPTLWLE